MTYERLSERDGQRTPSEPWEGVPGHLHYHLLEWVGTALSGAGESVARAVMVRLEISTQHPNHSFSYNVKMGVRNDPLLHLDAIDLILSLNCGDARELDLLLGLGGSVWAVEDDRLERRVSREARDAARDAMAEGDDAANQLEKAWRSAFGLNPDPDAAWDQAIKAVEELLIPAVVPNQRKANLGHVAGELKSNPGRWSLGLPGDGVTDPATALEGMLRLMWPNPGRHGGSPNPVEVSRETGEQVVHLAVAILNLCRGRIQRVD